MLLLYDKHCYVCALFTFMINKITKGTIMPLPLQSFKDYKVRLLALSKGVNIDVTSWVMYKGFICSGIYMVPYLLLGLFKGLIRSNYHGGTFKEFYEPNSCTINKPCSGMLGLTVRFLHFLSKSYRLKIL